MKSIFSGLIKNQSGQGVLAMVLILVILGGLIIGPLLAFMGTGLKAGQMHESKEQELYAADSGVEDAIYWLPQLHASGGSSGPYENWVRNSYEINDRNVDVSVENVTSQTYKISSIATSDDGSNTTVVSYVSASFLDFGDLLQSAITSNATVTIQPGTTISGNVTLPDADNLNNKGTINGTVNEEVLDWPTAEQLRDFYLPGVNQSDPFPYDTIDLKYESTIRPLYRDGSLTVKNTASTTKNATVEGTIYVTGDLTVMPDCGLVLNGQTIIAEGFIDLRPGCAIYGSGCIIAVGDLFFNPSVSSEPNYFLLIMSVAGDVKLNPSGDFYGAVVGNVEVDTQPKCSLNWLSPKDQDLNFPGEGDENEMISELSIVSWEII